MYNKAKRLSTVVALGLGLLLALLWVLKEPHTTASARTDGELFVCQSGCVYSTIQAAVDAASGGDTIKVAAGTYDDLHVRPRCDVTSTGVVTQVVYIDKSVTIQGGYTPQNWVTPDPEANPTTLDAGGQGRVIYVTGDVTVTIEGMRVTDGNADGLGGFRVPVLPKSRGKEYQLDEGGGIYIISATVTIRNSQIFSNTAPHDGGGLYALVATVEASDNRIFDNTVPGNGGGGGAFLCNSNVILSENDIFSNAASHGGGGGVYLFGTKWYTQHGTSVVIDANTFVSNTSVGGGAIAVVWGEYAAINHNTFTANTATWHGGGIAVYYGRDLMIRGNTLTANTSNEDGGGLYLTSADGMIDGNILISNTTPIDKGRGGGIYMWYSRPTMTNNVIVANQSLDGGGIFVNRSHPRLSYTTIARNVAGGVDVAGDGIAVADGSTIVMTNTILAGHNVGISVRAGTTATLNATLWDNTVDCWASGSVSTGTVNYWGYPVFAADGYHLTSLSPAIDAGIDAGVSTDLDNDPRPVGAGYDLGADEFGAMRIYLPVIQGENDES